MSALLDCFWLKTLHQFVIEWIGSATSISESNVYLHIDNETLFSTTFLASYHIKRNYNYEKTVRNWGKKKKVLQMIADTIKRNDF